MEYTKVNISEVLNFIPKEDKGMNKYLRLVGLAFVAFIIAAIFVGIAAVITGATALAASAFQDNAAATSAAALAGLGGSIPVFLTGLVISAVVGAYFAGYLYQMVRNINSDTYPRMPELAPFESKFQVGLRIAGLMLVAALAQRVFEMIPGLNLLSWAFSLVVNFFLYGPVLNIFFMTGSFKEALNIDKIRKLVEVNYGDYIVTMIVSFLAQLAIAVVIFPLILITCGLGLFAVPFISVYSGITFFVYLAHVYKNSYARAKMSA